MVDVLLVNPYVLDRHEPRRASYRPYPPLGLMYLGAVLRTAGYSVEIYDGTFARGPEDFASWLDARELPQLAGVYAMNSFRDDALATIKLLKDRSVRVWAGGPDPSIYDEEYLRGGVDVVVRGEGEVAILDLMEAHGFAPGDATMAATPVTAVAEISGASVLDDHGVLVRADDRPASKTMDSLPPPAYDLVDIPQYADEWRRVHGYASVQFMTSRGCPFSCTWCARPIFGRRYRQYSATRAAEEIAGLVEQYGIEHLWLFDDTFVVRRAWVEEFCEALIAKNVKVKWECLARTDLVDEDLLTLMKRAGVERINFGFESGSQRVLDAMKKGTTVVDARRVAEAMHRLGIGMGGYVLFGYPGEEWEDIEKTIELIRDIQPVDYSTSVALPMPGTEFYGLVQQMMHHDDWAARDADSLIWNSPYSRAFYRVVESLMHAEYDLGLEFNPRTFMKAKVLRGVLRGMRATGDGKANLERYRSDRFRGWKGLRKPEQSARHRQGHKKRADARRGQSSLKVLS